MSEVAQITAAMVNELRARTGAGLMDCKRALVETQGNAEAAIDFLRAKGLASAAKKADRESNDGLVVTAISEDKKQGAIVQISCETDFVAKTDDFKAFCQGIADHALANKPANMEELLSQTMANGNTVEHTLKEQIAKLGENMTGRAAATLEADYINQYIHIGGKVGVLLAMNTQKANEEAVATLAKDVCMHIAATSPAALNREEVDADLVAKEKEIAKQQAEGKPEAAQEKIITGKLEKFYAQSVLLEQPFVKNPDVTVKALVEQVSKEIGDEISIKAFYRFQVGA